MIKWFKGIWTRIKRRRRINVAKTDKTPLREFIYLDEVSVYSLLASRKGPLATEYTDTQQNAESSEVSGSLGSSSGVIKASTSSKLASTQTRTTQVLRKSTIQAAFKELLEGEQGKLAIAPISQKSDAPRVTTWNELERAAQELASDAQWVIDPDTLTRGRLFELAIELAPDEVYRMTSMVDEVVNIVSDSPQLFPVVPFEVQKVASINRVLDSLLVGLIPLKCRVLDYRVVELGSKKFLVHNEVLKNISSASNQKITDVYVTGVTEQRLFWKDVRRVLFSDLQFRAMCRANGRGLQDSWIPVKLFNVLRDVIPDLANDIDEMVRNVFGGQELSQPAKDDMSNKEREALIDYGLMLADHYGSHLDRSDLEVTVIEILNTKPNFQDLESRRTAFSQVAERVSDALGGISIEPMVAGEIRSTVTIDAGIGSLGGLSPTETSGKENSKAGTVSTILDVEIVAVYW
jgi:hypothetical protein